MGRAHSTVGGQGGFTLIELLVAVSILAVMVTMVYGSFVSVANSADVAREVLEEIRLRQFITRSLNETLPSAHVDVEGLRQAFQFLGENEEGPFGPADRLRFCSSLPLTGPKSLPGVMKIVTYELVESVSGEGESLTGISAGPDLGDEAPALYLQYTEQPLIMGDEALGEPGETETEEPDVEAFEDTVFPGWTVPVRSMDILYFDGEEWLETWDSISEQHLPWAVEIKINVAKSEGQIESDYAAGMSSEEDPDIRLVISLPEGTGVNEPFLPLNPALANVGAPDVS